MASTSAQMASASESAPRDALAQASRMESEAEHIGDAEDCSATVPSQGTSSTQLDFATEAVAEAKDPAPTEVDSDSDGTSSTEYVPVAERGPPELTADLVDAVVQPNRAEKRRRREEKEAADERCRRLGFILRERHGQAAVDSMLALL